MKYLFFDNCRGFKNTILPLKNVNFFVGENSTGKTSILTLISYLESPSFWLRPEIEMDEEESSFFRDTLNIYSRDDPYFHIGFYENDVLINKLNAKKHCLMITFKQQAGVPTPYFFTCIINDQMVNYKFNRNQVLYRFEKIENNYNDNEAVKKLFSSLTDGKFYKATGYTAMKKLRARSLGNLYSLFRSYTTRSDNPKSIFQVQWPNCFQDLTSFAPIRTAPRPIYSNRDSFYSPTGEHTPYRIKELLSSRKKKGFLEFTNKFGISSHLYESVHVKKFGKPKSSPFEIDVFLNNQSYKLNSVGYGVSQSLPLVVEFFDSNPGTWFSIQQPEIHLHPRAQSSLGDLFYKLASDEDHKYQFIIETHSDFIIDSFRASLRKAQNGNTSSQIVFFERNTDGNFLQTIEIAQDGSLPENQPIAYRDFFINEQLRVLGL